MRNLSIKALVGESLEFILTESSTLVGKQNLERIGFLLFLIVVSPSSGRFNDMTEGRSFQEPIRCS